MKLPDQKKTLTEKEAANELIGCAPQTLRISRCTGKLMGVAAPEYIKIGRSVRYKRETLEKWLSQFEEQATTVVRGA